MITPADIPPSTAVPLPAKGARGAESVRGSGLGGMLGAPAGGGALCHARIDPVVSEAAADSGAPIRAIPDSATPSSAAPAVVPLSLVKSAAVRPASEVPDAGESDAGTGEPACDAAEEPSEDSGGAPPRRSGWQRTRSAVKRGAVVLLIIVAAWGGGLIWFAAIAARIPADDGGTTDAIVVLTGGSVRVATGLRLLIEQRAPKLFVSGVHHGVDLADLLRVSQLRLGALECCVVLGHSADDTRGNARETAAWVHSEGLRSVRLVTANYHMPRSLYEFARAMPGVDIRPYPVAPAAVHLDQWWRWPGTAELIAEEYNKFLWAHLRGFVETLVDSDQI